jgi:RHS repeat-associated protein
MSVAGHRITRIAAVAASAATVATMLISAPAQAAAHKPSPPHPQRDRVISGRDITHGTIPRSAAKATRVRQFSAPAPAWPAAGTTTVAVGPAAVHAGASPVSLSSVAALPATAARSAATGRPAPAVPAPARVRVQVYDHSTATRAGVNGVLLALTRADGVASAGPVRVSVGYGTLQGAYGAGWKYRLRLVELTGCAATIPVPVRCHLTTLPASNDFSASTLSASVTLPASATSGVLVAAAASASGGSGSFAATTLQPSGSWSVGGDGGGFSWSYPLRTPPSAGGPVPSLSLTYNSASVDGEMAASNNQPSWAGEGFGLSPGYIERSYIACSQDMGGTANNTTATGDLCWSTNNATLSFTGHSGDLIQDAGTSSRWHLRDDDGTYAQHRTGAGNGAQGGEYWVVTTPNGTQYWFGDSASSNSAWTEPVYGNNPREPCYQSSFPASSCTQAWRWNLDKIVDPSGNTITYRYAVETNMYAADDVATAPVTYDRGGYLTEIDYGTTTSSTGNAPMRVVFTTGDRCVTSSCGTHDAANWPDTPWDQQCTGSPCLSGSPTFWSAKMLNSISTQLYSGSGSTYNTVTTWTLTHAFPDPGDGTRAGLWLSSIQETGHDGGMTTSTPPVTFTPVQLQNRVDPVSLGLPPMNWMRVAQIVTESGDEIEVSYSPVDCVPGSRMPGTSDLQDNPYRCYPVIWTPAGFTSPITDFFNKYVVTAVNSVDLTTAGNPATTTSYQYLGTPAWHYTDDNGVVPPGTKTWSVWRGYGDVKVTTGTGAAASTTETLYFRGMNGDHLPSGRRSAQMPAVDMNNDGSAAGGPDLPAVNDDDALAGMTREAITRNGSALVSATASAPWESAATATRTASGITVTAVMTGVADTRTETILDHGRAPRTTSVHTDFDATYGQPVAVQDNGDDAISGDETCTLTTYDRNAPSNGSAWLVAYPARVLKSATTCAVAEAGGLSAAQVSSDRLTYYDGATSAATPPPRGLVTRVDVLKDWMNGAPVYLTSSTTAYDSYGRVTSFTDVRANTTTTSYATNAGGQISGTTTTNVLGWATTTTLDPATGNQLTSTDPNGRITAQAYDGLGRLTAGWEPGRDQATQSANTTYAYLIRANAPSVITTSKLTPAGAYASSYTLYDGMFRQRQTQAPRGDGTSGALVTDTFYDSAGRAYLTYAPYLAPVAPGPDLFVANQAGDIPKYTVTSYDGAGRTIAATVYVNSTGIPQVYSTTTTGYGGDRTDVTPPAGSTANSTITDARGNTIARLQYHGATPTPFTPGSYDQTSYAYNAKDQEIQVTDAAGNQWSFGYDMMGRQVRNADPDTGTTTTNYDDAGDITSTTDARGTTLVYAYDQLGRKAAVYQGTVTAANELAAWAYDGLTGSRGQLTSAKSFSGGNTYARSILGLTATYQPTAVSYTIPAAESGLAGTYTYVFTYAPDGSLATTRIPSVDGGQVPTETLTQGYTAFGQPYSLSTSLPSATTLVPSIQYTGYGELGVLTLQGNGGNAAYLQDNYTAGPRTLAEQLVSRQVSPTTISDTHYAYDASGNPTETSDSVAADNQCFGYDYLDRLVSAWTPGNGNCAAAKSVAALGGPAPYWTDWTFGSNGTRATQVQHDTASGTQTTSYSTPPAGAALPHAIMGTSATDSTGTQAASYGYDPSGDVTSRPGSAGATQTLAWDAQDRLASVTGAGQADSYVYDVDGSRLVERDAVGKTLYLPGQELRFTTATAAKATTRYYAIAGVTVAMRTSTSVTWLFTDNHGTATVALDAVTQNVVIRRMDPYGNPRGTTTGAWPSAMTHGYVGGTNDPSGLVNIGSRVYDPATGTFLSADPSISYGVPQRLDAFAYSDDNPVRLSDPTGNSPSGGGSGDVPFACGASASYCAFRSYLDFSGFNFGSHSYQKAYTLTMAYCQDYGRQCWGNDGGGPTWVDTSIFGPLWLYDEATWHVTVDYGPCYYGCHSGGGGGSSSGGGSNGGGGSGNSTGTGDGGGQQQNTPTVPTNSPICPGNYQPANQLPPSCSFWDMMCATQTPGAWLGANWLGLLGAGLTLAGAGICIIATAGVCGAASAIIGGIAATAQVGQFIHAAATSGDAGTYLRDPGHWLDLGVNLAVDVIGVKVISGTDLWTNGIIDSPKVAWATTQVLWAGSTGPWSPLLPSPCGQASC